MLSGSVGQGGMNNPVDVIVVQLLLNDWLGKKHQTQLNSP